MKNKVFNQLYKYNYVLLGCLGVQPTYIFLHTHKGQRFSCNYMFWYSYESFFKANLEQHQSLYNGRQRGYRL